MQLDQQPQDGEVRSELARRAFAIAGVEERPSMISVPGARALWLEDGRGPADGFMMAREFAHLHPAPDESLHMMLPPGLASEAVDKGWAEVHPVAAKGLIPGNAVMVYAPRDREELEIVFGLVEASFRYALGD
jgi:hypothetical protein